MPSSFSSGLSALALLLFLTGPVWAAPPDGPPPDDGFPPPPPPHGGDHGPPGGHFGRPKLDLTPLNLTAEQKELVTKQRAKFAQSAKPLRQELQAKGADLRDSMFDPKSTVQEILRKRSEVQKLREKMDALVMDDFLAIRKILTPEQLTHLPEIKPPDRHFGDVKTAENVHGKIDKGDRPAKPPEDE